MQVKVLLFATLKDLVGTRQHMLDLPTQATINTVREVLIEQYPHVRDNLRVALAAVNQEFAQAVTELHEGDEVAFFPPVSGGEPLYPEIFQLASEPIDHDALIESITTIDTGAVCLFSGFVRGQTNKPGHMPQVTTLEYEAYEGMALAKMKQVADEIHERWPGVQGIAIVQRVGRLSVGQNTVLIACASAHRDEGCFEGARYGIDRLKEIVPVWKKEIGPTGETWIEGQYRPNAE